MLLRSIIALALAAFAGLAIILIAISLTAGLGASLGWWLGAFVAHPGIGAFIGGVLGLLALVGVASIQMHWRGYW